MSRLGAVAIAAGVLALYLLRLDPAAGLYIDDGWYIVLAKALANGDGYALISSAATPILPAFPPGFPLLLAPVVAMTAEFPANVVSLKAVSIAAMFGIAVAAYLFLVRYRGAPAWLAGAVALITVLMPAFVFLATSTVMAECAFTLGQMGLVLVVERAVRMSPSPRSRAWLVLGGVLGGATVLIRAAGIAPLAAAALYLLVKRGWRASAGFALVAALCYAPWALYAAAHRPTPAERMAHGGGIAYSYAELMAMESGGVAEGRRVGIMEVASRAGANLVNVLGRDLGALILPAAYRGASESGVEVFALSGETGLKAGSMGGGPAILWVSSVLSGIAIVGFVSALRQGLTVAELIVPMTIAMVVMVPSRTFRYVLPLAPFIVFYFLSGLDAVIGRLRLAAARPGAAAQIAALSILGLLGMEHAQYAWQVRNGPLVPWLRDYQEVRAVSDWMNANLRDPGAVVATNPPLVFLLTGRKTVALVDVVDSWPRWQGMGVRYAAAFHVTEQPPERLGYRLLFKSPVLGLWLLELTENASRP